MNRQIVTAEMNQTGMPLVKLEKPQYVISGHPKSKMFNELVKEAGRRNYDFTTNLVFNKSKDYANLEVILAKPELMQ